MRTRSERRFNNVRKSIHKKNICNIFHWYGYGNDKYSLAYRLEHRYPNETSLLSLSKTNLSCDREFECRKTNSKYNGYNPSISDRRKMDKIKSKLLDFFFEK